MVKEQKLIFGTTLKYFDKYDVALMKLSLITFTLFLVSLFPVFAGWVVSTSWIWFFLVFLLFAIRPLKKAFQR